MLEMIKDEFKHILHNRLLLLSVTVMCFIPFLYSIFFLKSVWNPYGNTQDLPVAVVNKDIPVKYQGKTMNVGKQTVNELKKNHQLKWEFVSPESAKTGMAHRKYYAVITIPEDFSKNATTVTDEHPKAMKLHYKTNGSLNYIGEVITQMGATKLNSKIQKSVTKAYATAMFKQLHVVGKGMKTAATGAKQLNDGLVTLNNGANQYVAGVSMVNNGVQTLRVKVTPLSAGANQLANGANQLSTGTGQLANGAAEMNHRVNASLGALNTQGIMGMMNQAMKVQQDIDKLSGKLNTAEEAIGKLHLDKVPDELTAMSNAVATGAGLTGQLGNVQTSDNKIAAKAHEVQNLREKIQQSNLSETDKATLNDSADTIYSQATQNAQSINDIQSGLGTQFTKLGRNLTTLGSQLPPVLNQMNVILPEAKNVLAEAKPLMDGLKGYRGQIQSLPSQIKQLQAGTAALATGAGQVNGGANQLAGALGQLKAQVPALVSGVNQLANGTQELQDKGPQLISGIGQLNAGSSKLAKALFDGSNKINGVKTNNKQANMFAQPTKLKHSNYSYVPNYGHALAPYVLSVALYVGALIFNFVYPIRRVAKYEKSPSAWWASKVVVGSAVITAMAVIEGAIMMACGLTVDHVPSFFLTTICFGLASMAVVMFLSMTFDNPGRFIAMVLLMLQLGGSGGTFPMEITMKFYNVIHWGLPMTYSILGLRDSITGGLGMHYTMFCNLVLIGIAVVFFLLLLISMHWLQNHHFAGRSELDENQKLLELERSDDGMHLQQRPPMTDSDNANS